MRTLTTLVLIGFVTLACHDARVGTNSRTDEEKRIVQEEHKKEMKEATDAYRSMKISDMAGQKQDDKKSQESAEKSKEDSKIQGASTEQKPQP